MPVSTWAVTEPRSSTFDEPVTTLNVRIVNGTVNVVGTDEGTARLEVSGIEGPPLIVTQEDGTLTVAYEDLPWKGFLKWFDRKGWHRSAVVSLAVPGRVDGRGRRGRRRRGRLRDPGAYGGARRHAATRRSSASPARSARTRSPAMWRPRPSPATSASTRSPAI